MGGWWLTWEHETLQIQSCSTEDKSQDGSKGGYLLTDVMKSSVFSVVLVRFSKDRVERFVTISPGCPSITRDGECCNINLRTCKHISEPHSNQSLIPASAEDNLDSPSFHRDHRCGWQCPAGLSTPAPHWPSAAKTVVRWEQRAWTPWTGPSRCCCTGWSWCQRGYCQLMWQGGWSDDLWWSNITKNSRKWSVSKTEHTTEADHQLEKCVGIVISLGDVSVHRSIQWN